MIFPYYVYPCLGTFLYYHPYLLNYAIIVFFIIAGLKLLWPA